MTASEARKLTNEVNSEIANKWWQNHKQRMAIIYAKIEKAIAKGKSSTKLSLNDNEVSELISVGFRVTKNSGTIYTIRW